MEHCSHQQHLLSLFPPFLPNALITHHEHLRLLIQALACLGAVSLAVLTWSYGAFVHPLLILLVVLYSGKSIWAIVRIKEHKRSTNGTANASSIDMDGNGKKPKCGDGIIGMN